MRHTWTRRVQVAAPWCHPKMWVTGDHVTRTGQLLSVKTCPRTDSRALNGWTGHDSKGGVFFFSPAFSTMLSDWPEGGSSVVDWLLDSGSERLSRMSWSSWWSRACWLQQYSAAGSRGWASVLKMNPPTPNTHRPPSPPSSQDPLPSIPPPWRKWLGSKSRYRYLMVSARKKDSIRLSSWWSRKSLTCSHANSSN